MRRVRREDGQAAIEFVGFLPLLVLAVAFVWQIDLILTAANSAESAARTASRVLSRGGDPQAAGVRALPTSLRDSAKIIVTGERVDISADAPTIFPGVSTGMFHVHGKAQIPGQL